MRSTETTKNISIGIAFLYVLYGMFALPFAYFLLSLAVGLIIYGGSESAEISVIAMVLTGVVSLLIGQSQYAKALNNEGFTGNQAEEIAKKVASIRVTQPTGVFASGYVEGFEDVAKDNEVTVMETLEDSNSNSNSEKAPETNGGASPNSTPAPAKSVENQGFKDKKEPEGLFKLGAFPTEEKGGFHIDQGTTVLNALNALKPDEVKKMSEDTQKLIDTQKSLMMMLGTMKPMLNDGRQLMETFQQMFGKDSLQPNSNASAK
jgi:hypothetical protein